MDQNNTSLGELFDKGPGSVQYGLRGDAVLWKEFATTLRHTPLPRSVADLEEILETCFREATGCSLSFFDEVYIERLDQGGMSRGMLSGEFWRDRGFPLIIERFKKMKG
jgi:hypothetical protein